MSSKAAGTSHPISFLARHNHLLTFVGALIVFATFVVKEGLREDFKEKASNVSEQVFRYQTLQQLHLIRDLLEQPHAGTKSSSGQPFAPGDIYLARFISINNELQLLTEFNKSLPDNDEEGGRLDSINKAISAHPGTFVYDLEAQSAPSSKVKDAQKDLDDLEKRVYAELFRLEDLSKADRDEAEAWYDRATFASYFLYTLGWGLGLVARLFGADDRGDET